MTHTGVLPTRLWRWGPLVLWMGVISMFSTEAFAASETSRYIGPLLRWLFPAASSVTLDAVHIAIRKGMHVSEFAILAFLWYRSLTWEQQGWRPKAGLAAFGLTVLFASLDEAHQAFVATRTGTMIDVGWDGLGALCGLVGYGVLRGKTSTAKSPDAPKEDPPARLSVPLGD